MKRGRYLCLFAVLLFLLCGCMEGQGPETRIPVGIRESAGFTVENNGQLIQPGEDVVFLLNMDSGFAVMSTDYDGDYHTTMDGSQMKLTLKNVQYPTRVSLELTDSYATITYEPNGGLGEATTIPYDTTIRPRINTSTGTGLFSREGYTLESWNTQPDGTGERIGLGSRTSVPDGALTLYAQWAQWNGVGDFTWIIREEGVIITGYNGSASTVVIPAAIVGRPVTAIAAGAFQDCAMTGVILPETMIAVEDGAFRNCDLDTLTLFDNIESIGDDAFEDCMQLKTLRINAIEKPYGTLYRRESCYADKVDMMIQAQGEEKIIFYGGCSVWYNLDSSMLTPLTEQGYRVINMGLNGLSNSSMQMQILGSFLESGDILFHTPELSSATQMMLNQTMDVKDDNKLWCGLEYNYDLVTLVDMRTLPGMLKSFCDYLATKKDGTSYNTVFTENGNIYCDEYGCVPIYRDKTAEALPDRVYLDPSYIDSKGMARLQEFYDEYQEKGVRVYLSYACVNMDDVPEEQRGSVDMVDWQFRQAIEAMDGPVLISHLEDFLYYHDDFYDTNYHLLSEPTRVNTGIWLRDLQAQMERDGLWEAP